MSSKFLYEINFNEGGKVVLERALKSFLTACEKKIEQGELAPYTGYQITAQNLLDQIEQNKKEIPKKEGLGIFKDLNR